MSVVLAAEVKLFGPTERRGARWKVTFPPTSFQGNPISVFVPKKHDRTDEPIYAAIEASYKRREVVWEPMQLSRGEYVYFRNPKDPGTFYVPLKAKSNEA